MEGKRRSKSSRKVLKNSKATIEKMTVIKRPRERPAKSFCAQQRASSQIDARNLVLKERDAQNGAKATDLEVN